MVREVTMSLDHGSSDVLQADDEYRKLEQEHREYEMRLLVFSDKVVLTDDEQVEETMLKKKKLQLKDKMAALSRQGQTRAGAAYP
jgi:uncharacterized protein YdcH (DUF465 family)